jgi:hypothetical protein
MSLSQTTAFVIGVTAVIAWVLFGNRLRVRYHIWRARAAAEMMHRYGTPTTMPAAYSARFTHHQRALIRLGYLLERRFDMSHSLPARDSTLKIQATAQGRFPEGLWSLSPSRDGSWINVTARPGEMDSWEVLLAENDWRR